MKYGQRFMTLYRRQGSRPSPRKRRAKSQNGLANSCETKRSEKQRREEKIQASEHRVLRNNKER